MRSTLKNRKTKKDPQSLLAHLEAAQVIELDNILEIELSAKSHVSGRYLTWLPCRICVGLRGFCAFTTNISKAGSEIQHPPALLPCLQTCRSGPCTAQKKVTTFCPTCPSPPFLWQLNNLLPTSHHKLIKKGLLNPMQRQLQRYQGRSFFHHYFFHALEGSFLGKGSANVPVRSLYSMKTLCPLKRGGRVWAANNNLLK